MDRAEASADTAITYGGLEIDLAESAQPQKRLRRDNALPFSVRRVAGETCLGTGRRQHLVLPSGYSAMYPD